MKTLIRWLLSLVSAVVEGGKNYADRETEMFLFGRSVKRKYETQQ